jgi:hypothetical protein
MEAPERESNAHRLYRYGERSPWNRYIIPPRGGAGMTVLDVVTVAAFAVAAALLVWGVAFGSWVEVL